MLEKMNSFLLRLESILVFLINQMEDTWRKIDNSLGIEKGINFYFMIMITDITDIFQLPKFPSG